MREVTDLLVIVTLWLARALRRLLRVVRRVGKIRYSDVYWSALLPSAGVEAPEVGSSNSPEIS